MSDAYVLINCEAGCEKPVLEELKQFENITVRTVHLLYAYSISSSLALPLQ